MSVTFGSFIKEKRIKNNYLLKDVAEIVGISAVYQSCIETGKRHAPSYKVLVGLGKALKLDEDEFSEMLDLAVRSKDEKTVAYDIADYINDNSYIRDAIRFSIKHNVSESDWEAFYNNIKVKYD